MCLFRSQLLAVLQLGQLLRQHCSHGEVWTLVSLVSISWLSETLPMKLAKALVQHALQVAVTANRGVSASLGR